MPEPGSFERETWYRLFVEAVRFWVVSTWLATKTLPKPLKIWIYSGGPNGIDWGNPPGMTDPNSQPLRYKRIVVTVSIEDHNP